MNCPYCGTEMEQSVISSRDEISWARKRHLIGRADFHEGSIVLLELSFMKGSAVVAFLCRNCEKVVIDYKDGTGDNNNK